MDEHSTETTQLMLNIFKLPWDIQEYIWRLIPEIPDEPEWINKYMLPQNVKNRRVGIYNKCVCKYSWCNVKPLHISIMGDVVPQSMYFNMYADCPYFSSETYFHKCICEGPYVDEHYDKCKAWVHKCICNPDEIIRRHLPLLNLEKPKCIKNTPRLDHVYYNYLSDKKLYNKYVEMFNGLKCRRCYGC